MDLASALAIRAIEAYQRAGGGKALLWVECDFNPTCSEYTRQAIERFGLIAGYRLGMDRICRCRGGVPPGSIADPVPAYLTGDLALLDAASLERQEDLLRERVSRLPDDKRAAYYRLAEPLIKDPDTYATLNYFAPAGLHHFYLGKRLWGTVNLTLFIVGVLTIPLAGAGLGLILLILLFEVPQLMRAQRIVKNYNIEVGYQVLAELGEVVRREGETLDAEPRRLAGPGG